MTASAPKRRAPQVEGPSVAETSAARARFCGMLRARGACALLPLARALSPYSRRSGSDAFFQFDLKRSWRSASTPRGEAGAPLMAEARRSEWDLAVHRRGSLSRGAERRAAHGRGAPQRGLTEWRRSEEGSPEQRRSEAWRARSKVLEKLARAALARAFIFLQRATNREAIRRLAVRARAGHCAAWVACALFSTSLLSSAMAAAWIVAAMRTASWT